MRTRIWKLAALTLALLLALTGCSLIEIDQEMDDAEAVATVNGVIITKGEAKDTYDYYQNYYAYLNYYYTGKSDISGMLDQIRDDVLEAHIRNELIKQKAAGLGLDQLTDEDKADIEAKAAEELENYVTQELDAGDIDTEGKTDEEIRAAALAHLEEEGITLDTVIENETRTLISDRVRSHVIENVSISDSELEEAFNEKVSADESSYSASTYLYERNQVNGTTIYWNPEGYRTVKHILLQMSDEQSAELKAIEDELSGVEDMIAELEAPADETADEDAEPAGGEAEKAEDEAETEGDADETEEESALSLDELNARKAELEADVEAKKAEIVASFAEKIDEINAKLADGASFDELMAEYGEDPGMKSDPSMTAGYYVCAASTTWETVFRDTAMALEKVGDVSEPVLGSSGVHIIFYNSDVTPGAVALDTVRDELQASLLETKQDETFEAEYKAWYDAAKIKKYPNRLG